jgi:RimJ/RimL family protein N-acetyltransferase
MDERSRPLDWNFLTDSLVEEETGRIVDNLQFSRERDEIGRGTAEIGFSLDPSVWDKGLATEVAGPFVAFGFAELKLETIRACVRTTIVGSRRVLEKLGFRPNGRPWDGYDDSGNPMRETEYELTRPPPAGPRSF